MRTERANKPIKLSLAFGVCGLSPTVVRRRWEDHVKTERKLRLLRRLLEKSGEIGVESSSDPDFKAWKDLVERTLVQVYGAESPEVEHFKRLRFFYSAPIMALGSDYSADHLRVFRTDLALLKKSIGEYIEELEDAPEDDLESVSDHGATGPVLRKLFISHSSKDAQIVEELIELLEAIGLPSESIFCSSFEGYGIDLGENFLEAIRNEFLSECLVIFVLSENFYSSPISLCEMGAAWVAAKEHIPVLLPPFEFKQVEGVIPLTQGFVITEPLKLNLFRESIERLFGIQSRLSQSGWERKRDRIVARIEDKLSRPRAK